MTIETQYMIWRIRQGATLYVPFAIEATDGTTYDLAEEGDGYTIGACQVRTESASEGGELLLDLTTDNGGMVLTAFTDASGDWSGYLYASAAATAALVPWGDGQFDLEIRTSAGDAARVEIPFAGDVSLVPNITVEE
jgi:hypothetical protein